MYSRISENFTPFICCIFFIFFSGCSVPIIYLCAAGSSLKDVSNDFERGHVVGKTYEILQDVYLTQLRESETLTMSKSLAQWFTWKNNKLEETNPYRHIEKVPKGTKFKVINVFVKTYFGKELCSQTILANLIDENGCIIPIDNNSGTITPIDVSLLFEDTSQLSDENWIFNPSSDLIKEI